MKLVKILFYYFLAIVSIFFVGRAVLFALYFERFSKSDVNYWLTFLYGLRMDTIIACATLIIPLILLSLSPKGAKKFVNQFLTGYFLVVFLLFIYIENATLPFFAEYDVRPNFLFVEYLVYPKEVFAMIFSAYKLELFIAVLLLLCAAYIFIKIKKLHDFSSVFEIQYFKRLFPSLFFLCTLNYQGYLDIFHSIQSRNEVIKLKNKSYFPSVDSQFIWFHIGSIFSIN